MGQFTPFTSTTIMYFFLLNAQHTERSDIIISFIFLNLTLLVLHTIEENDRECGRYFFIRLKSSRIPKIHLSFCYYKFGIPPHLKTCKETWGCVYTYDMRRANFAHFLYMRRGTSDEEGTHPGSAVGFVFSFGLVVLENH